MASDEAEQSLLHEYNLDEGKHRASPDSAEPWLRKPSTLKSPRSLLSFATILLLIVSVTDVLALVWIANIFRTHYADQDFSSLEFGNPYVGLDSLYKGGNVNTSTIEPFVRKPRIAGQVFPGNQDKLAPAGAHDAWWDEFGTFGTNERHFQVDPDTHTVLQFRTIDFGMEDCELILKLPQVGQRLDVTDDTPFLFSEPSTLDVFSLDAATPLDMRKLSYRTRPPTKEKFATVAARPGEETVVKRFPCPWGSLPTFEVACADRSDCLVDLWSTQNVTWGMYVVQHQTI